MLFSQAAFALPAWYDSFVPNYNPLKVIWSSPIFCQSGSARGFIELSSMEGQQTVTLDNGSHILLRIDSSYDDSGWQLSAVNPETGGSIQSSAGDADHNVQYGDIHCGSQYVE